MSMSNRAEPIEVENPVLQENTSGGIREEIEKLRASEEYLRAVNITKKLLFLVLVYFKKGLRLRKKTMTKRKPRSESYVKAELKGFEELFNVIHQMAKRGILGLMVEVNSDAMVIRHCIFLLTQIINSNLIERKLIMFEMFELFNSFVGHDLFEPKGLLSSMLLTMEADYQHSIKFLGKLFKYFLDSNRSDNVRLLVSFSQSLMNSVVNTKHFSPDGQLAKNCRSLYEDLSAAAPEFFFRNFKIFKNFFASDYYIFRNIANSVVFEVILFLDKTVKILNVNNVEAVRRLLDETTNEGMEEGNPRQGEIGPDLGSARRSVRSEAVQRTSKRIQELMVSYLELILIRLNDKAVYTRSHTLKTISKTLKSNFFSKQVYICVFELVTKRTRDAKFNVRKRALIMVQEFLVFFRDRLEVPGYKRLRQMMDEERKKRLSGRRGMRDEVERRSQQTRRVVEGEIGKDEAEKGLEEMNENELEARDIVAPLNEQTGNDNEEKGETMTKLELELSLNLEIYEIIKKDLSQLEENLFSKNYSQECIQTLRIVNLMLMMEVKHSARLWRKSLSLVWVKDPLVKQELLKIFHKLYIDGCIPELVVKMFIGFRMKLDVCTRASFDEIIKQLLIQERVFRNDQMPENESVAPLNQSINRGNASFRSQNSQNYESASQVSGVKSRGKYRQEFWYRNIYLQSSIADFLWEYYQEYKKTELHKGVQALELLNLVLSVSPRYVYDKIDKFRLEMLELVKSPEEGLNWKVVAQMAKTFQFLKEEKNSNTPNLKELKTNFLMVMVDFLYSFQGTQNADYLDGMNEIVHLCFVYRKNPEIISEHILTKLMKFIFEEDEAPESGKRL